MGEVLKGKVAFVTGAAAKRGMGRAVALRLAKEGADVVVNDKFRAPKSAWTGDEDWKGLDDVVKEIEAMGRKALAVVAGVENAKEVDAAVKAALDKFGKIDILVNCAGIRGTVGVPVADGDEAEWRQLFDVNTMGPFIISRAVAKDMIRRNEGGKIVHIASAAGRIGAPGSAAYAASKWAVIGLVESLALELAPYKINVNAINPGFFATNLRDETAARDSRKAGKTIEQYREDEYKMLSKMVPLGRMGTTEDIAKLILFLVSPESDYMTGQDINITGGYLMP
jgi:meso-butanediol dehydrogenase / (S,S)-butanediol dehydrogenase / diacetyl reductase